MNHRAFTLIELLVVVAIIGILAAVGVVAYNGYTKGAKVAVVKNNHKTIEKWFGLKSVECEIDGKVTYSSWKNKGTTQEKNCNYSNGWQLVMDLGYNHFRYHFLAEAQYNKNFKNPYNPNSSSNPAWNNGCSNTIGGTTFYGNNKGQFVVWSNIGEAQCLTSSIQFPIN